MNIQEIDRMLDGTPCLCGAVDTWHQECYIDKTDQQIVREYSAVYARLRRAFQVQRRELVKATIAAVKRHYGDPRGSGG